MTTVVSETITLMPQCQWE